MVTGKWKDGSAGMHAHHISVSTWTWSHYPDNTLFVISATPVSQMTWGGRDRRIAGSYWLSQPQRNRWGAIGDISMLSPGLCTHKSTLTQMCTYITHIHPAHTCTRTHTIVTASWKNYMFAVFIHFLCCFVSVLFLFRGEKFSLCFTDWLCTYAPHQSFESWDTESFVHFSLL